MDNNLDNVMIPELRDRYKAIHELERGISEEEIKERRSGLAETGKLILHLSNVARKEGLLWLEDEIEKIPANQENALIRELILLVVDGTDPELVERVGAMRYFSSVLDPYMAVRWLMVIYGMLSIQAGDNPRVIKIKMESMASEEIEPEDENGKENEEKYVRTIDKEVFFSGGIRISEKSFGYLEVHLCDKMLCSLYCTSMQKILRELDTWTILTVVKGVSGEARKHIIENMSKGNSEQIMQDIRDEYPEGDPRFFITNEHDIKMIRFAALKFLHAYKELEMRGEIVAVMEPEFRMLSQILNTIEQHEAERKKKYKNIEMLIRMLERYKDFEEY